ncbi:unnamed protein product [Orchesella dallaii]|uniref:Uncharacterized protein n=1 Tax=Orchesella dallaii TaxID=48710 RepID=A0ABP1QU67_9HEXA
MHLGQQNSSIAKEDYNKAGRQADHAKTSQSYLTNHWYEDSSFSFGPSAAGSGGQWWMLM